MTVVHSDLFKVKQLPQMLKAFQPADGAKLKVVANIPYNITSGGQAPLGYQMALFIAVTCRITS